MAKKQKYYVVWAGINPGIYSNWEKCQEQIIGFQGAKYMSFSNLGEAEYAFQRKYEDFVKKNNDPKPSIPISKNKIISDSISVDAACSGNPGLMEYQGVETESGRPLFHQGPFEDGTNNVGEFLALVHALAMLQKKELFQKPIYSDSKIAMLWVKNKKAKTKLELTPRNKILFELIERAENWLNTNTYKNPIYKWETESWGEIPADFGRK
ncbi:MAG: ribonuclease H family protein [Saprospiraceae bacterium]